MEEWRIREGRLLVEDTRRKAMEALDSIYAGQQRGGAATRRDSDEAMEAAFVDQMEEWRELGLGVFNKLFKFHSSNPGHAYSCLEAISVDLNLDLETLRESYSDYASRTLLHHAAHQGWCSAIRWLREYGPANAGRNYLGSSSRILHTAVGNGHCDAVVILLDAGEQIESLDGVGFTPLHRATDRNLCNMCKLLLKRGASLDSKDRYGKNPEERARSDLAALGRLRSVGNNSDAADLLAAVRAAGGWSAYVAQPRAALLAFRRDLPTLRRLGPSSVRAHEWLFAEAPADVCTHALAFWQSGRDSEY